MANATKERKQSGFTILELIIATAVFSVVLLILTYGILQIGRTYYRGITSSRTQNVARAISDEIVQNLQFGLNDSNINASSFSVGSGGYFCINSKKYSGILGVKKVSTNHVFVSGQNCTLSPSAAISAPFVLSSGERELLSDGMVLQKLSIVKISPQNYEVTVRVASGDPDMFETENYLNGTTPTNCKSGTASQFCAVSELVTTARIR